MEIKSIYDIVEKVTSIEPESVKINLIDKTITFNDYLIYKISNDLELKDVLETVYNYFQEKNYNILEAFLKDNEKNFLEEFLNRFNLKNLYKRKKREIMFLKAFLIKYSKDEKAAYRHVVLVYSIAFRLKKLYFVLKAKFFMYDRIKKEIKIWKIKTEDIKIAIADSEVAAHALV